MRIRHVSGITMVLLSVLPGLAGAQSYTQPPTDYVPSLREGWVDFGVRASSLSGDPARYQRFRDLGDGAFLEVFRFQREEGTYLFEAGADHVGRQDQRFFADYRSGGKVRISFAWDQIPLFFSQDTRTLYSVESPGVLRLDDRIQQGVQSGAPLSNYVSNAVGLDARNRRDTASFSLEASPSRDWNLALDLKSSRRNGNLPWGASFGFNAAVEVAAPIDARTTDMSLEAEWSRRGNLFRVGYEASWFNNNIQTLVWDSPFKFTDSTNPSAYSSGNGTSQGRMSLWPSNNAHTLSATGALKLPARSRFVGLVAIGAHRQDEAILPFTINTALPALPLDRTTAQAEIRSVTTSLQLTSRPSRIVWLQARYRYADLDNRTPHFAVVQNVRFDQALHDFAAGGSEAFSITRQDFNADASFTPIPFTAFKLGYGHNQTDRTYRFFGTTNTNTVRASVDTTGNQYLSGRVLFEHSGRTGSDLDPHALDIVGEQPGMRHFDIANRDRNRVTALFTATPSSLVAFNASAATGKDDYPDSQFGLRDNQHRVYTAGFDVTPRDEVTFSLSYGHENYDALQNSRQASPGSQFDDPSRDWSIDSSDRVRSVYGSLELRKIIPKTEVRLSYDLSNSKSTYTYGLAAPGERTLPDGSPVTTSLGPVSQLAPVTNQLKRAIADTRYYLTPNVALGFVYWYERYDVDDFALGPSTLDRLDLPGGLLLDYLYRPYTAHTGWVRLTYLW